MWWQVRPSTLGDQYISATLFLVIAAILASIHAEAHTFPNCCGFSCFHAFAQTVPSAQNIFLRCLPGELSFHPHCLIEFLIYPPGSAQKISPQCFKGLGLCLLVLLSWQKGSTPGSRKRAIWAWRFSSSSMHALNHFDLRWLPSKGQRRGGNTVVHTRRTSIHRSEERWETVVQAHRCDSSLVEPFPTWND